MASTDLIPEEWRLFLRLARPETFLMFITMVSPLFERPSHLLPIAQLIVRATREPVRACISMPPRHGKTETIIHAILWWLLRDPKETVAYVSHTENFAAGRSLRARELAHYAGMSFKPGAKKMREWRMNDGGGTLALGIGGPLVGHGVNKLIIDDPIKNRQEAESALVRDRLGEWFQSSAMTRVMPGGSVIVVHTRWHDDDLIGRLTQSKEMKWEYVNLPAIDDNEQALWPSKWPLDAMRLRQIEVGPYEWASQYLGQPMPKGGRIFSEPARYDQPNFEGARFVIGCDPAASEKTTADFSAAVVMSVRGIGSDTVVEILEVYRKQVSVPQLVRDLAVLQRKWRAPIAVEAVGGFKAVPQMLAEIDVGLKVIPVTPLGDKHQRAQPVAAAWNSGRVRIPSHDAPWLGDFLKEVLNFTGVSDAHDDMVDALSHAFNLAMQTHAPMRRGAREIRSV